MNFLLSKIILSTILIAAPSFASTEWNCKGRGNGEITSDRFVAFFESEQVVLEFRKSPRGKNARSSFIRVSPEFAQEQLKPLADRFEDGFFYADQNGSSFFGENAQIDHYTRALHVSDSVQNQHSLKGIFTVIFKKTEHGKPSTNLGQWARIYDCNLKK